MTWKKLLKKLQLIRIREEKIKVAFYNHFIWICTENLQARFKRLCQLYIYINYILITLISFILYINYIT